MRYTGLDFCGSSHVSFVLRFTDLCSWHVVSTVTLFTYWGQSHRCSVVKWSLGFDQSYHTEVKEEVNEVSQKEQTI